MTFRTFLGLVLLTLTSACASKQRDEFIDSLRDNWWSLATPTASNDLTGSFLAASELAEGRAEWARLRDIASFGPNYLSAHALDWVRAHPADPRNAETLYWIVRALRYPPAGPYDSRYAKEAFQLLHSRYPRTEWARRTPYWYR